MDGRVRYFLKSIGEWQGRVMTVLPQHLEIIHQSASWPNLKFCKEAALNTIYLC